VARGTATPRVAYDLAPMPVTHRICAAVPALALVLALAAGCGGTTGSGGSPTTTAKPLAAKDMCTEGANVFGTVDELDKTKPDFLDKAKKAIKPLADRPPAEIAEDIKAFVAYTQQVTDPAQLGALPADLRVSTQRIDAWWKQNCGKPLIGS
jgi:hypothetical protein